MPPLYVRSFDSGGSLLAASRESNNDAPEAMPIVLTNLRLV